MSIADPIPELSRSVALDDLVGGQALELTIEATPEQRAALGKRLDLIEISSLAAKITVVGDGRRRVSVDVNYRADVVQSCVVTLEPVPATIEESFTQEFLRETTPSDRAEGNTETWVKPEEEAESLEDDELDVGELLTQCLSLALEPYPRKEGVSFAGFDTDGAAPNPALAVLGEIKFEAEKKRS